MIYTIALFILGLVSTGCGQAPDLSKLTLPEPAPTATIQPVDSNQPAPEQISVVAIPSPSPSPVPATLVQYANTQWNLICPALTHWDSATTTIQINYASYHYTFAADGVTYTVNSTGVTSMVGAATLLYGTNPSSPACTVTINGGQMVSIQ